MDITKQKKSLIKWNRKIHIYLGLFLLLFIWLFGISGLLLNHHWEFANSWKKREVISYDKSIEISEEREKHILVHEIMDKLNLNGSIVNLRYSTDSAHLNFIVSKPGLRYDIQAGLNDGKVEIKETKLDQWAIMRSLHTSRNPTLKEQNERYSNVIASIWSFSMDIVSVGLIIICLGGWYLWLQVGRKRIYLGLISITGGFILCIYILFF
ncbi:MAG: PepSY-associated TM helix domain-containing protein [Cyclobacteriaceae bacterium]|nr:PepSY-associated TM helix domain-containing protein [Cyclobacteriaceae bacterium]